MPAKYSNIDAGGVSFQITQTEKRELKTMIEEMKKLKTLYEAQLKVRERIGTLQKQVTSGQRLETQYHRDRLKTLESIFNRMKQINQVSLETLKRENPAVGLAWGRKGTSMGRYDYTPEAAGEVSGATRKKELTNSQKLVGVYNTLKKSYAWQLFYFSSVSILMAGMLSNSKVFAHFMDIIGSALGFIMDMLLVSVIPWVVKLVKFLFDVGAEVATWPDWIKKIIVGLGLLVISILAIKVYTTITETIAAIKAIGTAAKTASGAEGVGALSGALGILVEVLGGIALAGFILNLQEVKDALKGLSDFTEGFRTSLAGLFLRQVMSFSSIGGIADLINQFIPGYNFLTPKEEGELMKAGIYDPQVMRDIRMQAEAQGGEASYSTDKGYTSTVNVYIGDKALDKSMYESISNASTIQGIPRTT